MLVQRNDKSNFLCFFFFEETKNVPNDLTVYYVYTIVCSIVTAISNATNTNDVCAMDALP